MNTKIGSGLRGFGDTQCHVLVMFEMLIKVITASHADSSLRVSAWETSNHRDAVIGNFKTLEGTAACSDPKSNSNSYKLFHSIMAL